MAEYVINAQPRTTIGKKVNRLRREGLVPVIVYGPKVDPVTLQIPYRELELALMNAGGTNLIEMNADGETYNVLAREVQRDVIKNTIKHVDFFAIDVDARIVVDVPVHMVGESPVVVSRKGILLTGPNALSVEMTANNMIDSIKVNLEQLQELGDSIYVRDLELGDDVRILNDPEEMIARVSQSSAARREEALEALEALTASGEAGEEALEDEVEIVGEEEEEADEE